MQFPLKATGTQRAICRQNTYYAGLIFPMLITDKMHIHKNTTEFTVSLWHFQATDVLKQQILKVQGTSTWGPLNGLTFKRSPRSTITKEPLVLNNRFLSHFWEDWNSSDSQCPGCRGGDASSSTSHTPASCTAAVLLTPWIQVTHLWLSCPYCLISTYTYIHGPTYRFILEADCEVNRNETYLKDHRQGHP